MNATITWMDDGVPVHTHPFKPDVMSKGVGELHRGMEIYLQGDTGVWLGDILSVRWNQDQVSITVDLVEDYKYPEAIQPDDVIPRSRLWLHNVR